MKRPIPVTLIAYAVLLLSAFNAVRGYAALRQADVLRGLGLDGPLIALTLTGIAWSAGWLITAFGLFRLRVRARRWTLVAIVLYQLNLWIVRLAFERSSAEPLTRPADAALSLLSIVLVWGALSLPPARKAFRNRDE